MLTRLCNRGCFVVREGRAKNVEMAQLPRRPTRNARSSLLACRAALSAVRRCLRRDITAPYARPDASLRVAHRPPAKSDETGDVTSASRTLALRRRRGINASTRRSQRSPSGAAERVHRLPQHNSIVDYFISLRNEAFCRRRVRRGERIGISRENPLFGEFPC